MRKSVRIISFAALTAIAAFAVSCTKAEEINDPSNTSKGKIITIKAYMPEETKVAFEDNEGLRPTWQAGDKIAIVGTTTSVFTLTSGAGTTSGTFEGVAPTGDTFTIIYPGDFTSAEEIGGRSYGEQVQDGNASTAHLKYNVMLEGVTDYNVFAFSEDWAAENEATLTENGVIKFHLQLPAAISTVDEVRLNAPTAVFAKTNTSGTKISEISLGMSNVDVSMDSQILTAYIMTSTQAATVAAGSEWTISVISGEKTYVKSYTNSEAGSINGGTMHKIKLNNTNWSVLEGNGTETSPFQMSTSDDMLLIRKLLVENGPARYFTMTGNIDLTGISWTPLVTGNQCKPIVFDGNGNTISNLTVNTEVSFPSFAGVLDGTIKNVKFSAPNIKNCKSSGQQTAVVAGWAGRNSGDITATITEVQVTGATVNNVTTSTSSSHVTGIIAGQANGLTATDCSAEGTITAGINGKDNCVGGFVGYIYGGTAVKSVFTNCSAKAEITAYGRIGGGFAGCAQIKADFTNCSSEGTLSAPGGGQFGGFIGTLKNNGACTLTNCTSSTAVTTEAGSGNHSGFAGFINAAGCKIIGCSASGQVESPSYKTAGCGGFIGTIDAATLTVEKCSSTSNVYARTTSGTYSTSGVIGGIIGYVTAKATGVVVRKCSYSGTLKVGDGTGNGGSGCGGIIGLSVCATANGLTVENCWTSGAIESGNFGLGGIAGTLGQYEKISKCFSTMSIDSRHGAGGIVGRADKNTNAVATTYNNTIEKCIAWNTSITSRIKIGASNLSNGAVVGKSATNNIYTDNIRKPGMTFTCYSDTSYDVLFDQENTDANNGLSYNPSLGSYYYPYHGKVATDADATISDVASLLGWDSTIWDLTSDVPTLK